MKKKSLLIISVLLIAVLSIGIFAGCGSLSFSKAYGVNELKDTVQVSNVVLPDGATILIGYSNKNALVLMRNTNEYALFSVAKNAIVVDWTTDPIASTKMFMNEIVAWTIDSQSTTPNQLDKRVVDCEGTEIYSTYVGVDAAVEAKKVAFGDFDYSIVLKSAREAKLIKDNKVVKVVDLGISTPILENDFSGSGDIFASDENYLYHLASDVVAVYSLDTFKIVKLVSIENAVSLSENGSLNTYLLSDGKALAQVVTKLPDDARSYDYMTLNGAKIEKHKLDSYIIDVVSGKTKKVKLDYVIDNVIGEAELDGKFPVKYNFENMLVVRKIVNKSLTTSNVAIGIDNNGKVVYTSQIDGMNGLVGMQVDNDKFIFMDITGGTHVVDMNGNILKSFASVINEDNVVYGVGILKGKGLYAFNGDTLKIFDEQSTVQNWDNSVVYEENGTFTKYTLQGETVICSDTQSLAVDKDLMVYLVFNADNSIKITSMFSNAELVTAEKAEDMQILNDNTRIVKKGNNATIIFKN